MKLLSPDRVGEFFGRWSGLYEVRVPVRLSDGTRVLGTPGDGNITLLGGALPAKPTSAFFPQQAAVFSALDGRVSGTVPQPLPLLVAGFTPNDLACLRFIDRFFGEGWRDDPYFQRRDGAVVIGVSGFCGPAGALLPPSGGGCDLEFLFNGADFLVVSYSDPGALLARDLPDAPDGAELPVLKAAALWEDGDRAFLERASELLRNDRVPDSFWSEIGDRCIACTGCNLVCPTCTCFGVQDRRKETAVERSRMWDSCQFDGFMREAGGHNPLGSEALRTWRRIHHKLAADPERWGEISCFRCGRCDAVCPTGIGIIAVAGEMVRRYGKG